MYRIPIDVKIENAMYHKKRMSREFVIRGLPMTISIKGSVITAVNVNLDITFILDDVKVSCISIVDINTVKFLPGHFHNLHVITPDYDLKLDSQVLYEYRIKSRQLAKQFSDRNCFMQWITSRNYEEKQHKLLIDACYQDLDQVVRICKFYRI